MRSEMSANVAAFEQTIRSTLALAETFDEADWARPTDCPGWSVQDVVAHLASVEIGMLGEDAAPGHVLAGDPAHVRNALGRIVEIGVDARRGRTGPEVLAELREVLERRLAVLPGIDPEEPALAPTGNTVPYAELMVFRTFDCWVHEQDVRRAVGRPGNLGAPGAERARRIMTRGLPMVVGKRAGAEPGQTVAFEVGGDLPFTLYLEVDGAGKAAFVDHVAAPDTLLRMDWEAYMRLGTGRCGPGDVVVETAGDTALAGRILANMALTP
ncbi:maleylpyruvate isomerase family mycothiol-dependent enzyme [Actinomadura xylanilytica]|uniref:maleylpyruvate isomerase family mycothiol-dependent enzyme n=1 Tax=Actinomadura xylanilytica TaxID=887459 RepID=UPI00255B17EA|nr:maleylpyruvate isomerase family mycothiol-dependent enzyme [Actinomadura xylanilytica]MDL4775632.1 maleylpyruvate isomerase family mycothiol-dependent enzyme [Actinomadura xylanilytica]